MALSRNEKLRDISQRSGFSKSAIGRHRLKCVPREILADFKRRKSDPQSSTIFVLWPDDPNVPEDWRGKRTVFQGQDQPGPDSIEFVVRYAPRIAIQITEDAATHFAEVPANESSSPE
jgi:hypothetical protein